MDLLGHAPLKHSHAEVEIQLFFNDLKGGLSLVLSGDVSMCDNS